MSEIFIDEDEEQIDNEINEEVESEEDEDLSIKYYPVDLPSDGKLGYSKTVWYRDILVRDEKVLASATGKTYKKILGDILKSLLRDGNVYDKLSLQDRDFLLLWIWANNYTTHKDFEIQCPSCGHKGKLAVDLTKLDVSHLSEDYEHPFEMELRNGDTISLRLLTTKDESVVDTFIAKNPDYDYATVSMALSAQFAKVLPLAQKLKYMEDNVSGHDMSMIRAFHKHFHYGVDDEVDYECSECSEVTPFTIPFSPEFFMPVVDNDFEAMLRSNKRAKNKSNRRGSNAGSRSKRVHKTSK